MHPRIPHFDDLVIPTATAAGQGYRMPAEWEPIRRIWLTYPHNAETWPGCLPQAQDQFEAFRAALQRVVEVRATQDLGIPTNDSWIRDYGPIFVVQRPSNGPLAGPAHEAEHQGHGARGTGQAMDTGIGVSPVGPGRANPGEVNRDDVIPGDVNPGAIENPNASSPLALHDFHFNAWGGKYEVREHDDVVPQHIAHRLMVPVFLHDMVLEGGSIEVNGRGTVMTTGQCLLNKNRNPQMKKRPIEKALHDALGTCHVIWLPGGIVGDDTDGHIDDIARFINPTTVIGLRAPEGHPDKEILDRNWRVLKRARDQDGQKLTVVEMPVPSLIYYDFPPDRFSRGGHRPIAASYANFLICNGHVFVPVFGQPSDDLALRTLEQVMPGFRMVPIRAEHLVVGLGALHCLSQQEPQP